MSDSDFDDDDWGDDNDDPPLVPCPYCRAEMLEGLPQCPECGSYISEEDRPPAIKPGWLVAGVVLCLLLVLGWIVRQ